jgi:hypothetical protein
MYGSDSYGGCIVKQLIKLRDGPVALTTTGVLLRMVPARLGVPRQTTRQEILPDSGFDDDRRPAMYGSESLGRRLVKQLVRDAP